MPKPIIILENHLNPAAKIWLIKHLERLKKAGYTTFLFEMNQEISFENFLQQLQTLSVVMPDTDPQKNAIKKLLELSNLLTKLNIKIKFIDPENQKIAGTFNEAIKIQHDNSEELRKLMVLREFTTQNRDVSMADTIKLEAMFAEQNGIIFLGGYAHHNLIKLLGADACDYKIITDSNFDNKFPEFEATKSVWHRIKDDKYRSDYYHNIQVDLIDLATETNPKKIAFFKEPLSPEDMYQLAVNQYKKQKYNKAIETLLDCAEKFKLSNEHVKEAQCFSTIASCHRQIGIEQGKSDYLHLALNYCDIAEDILKNKKQNVTNYDEEIELIATKRHTVKVAASALSNIQQPTLQPGK